jgi:hypothetical protein
MQQVATTLSVIVWLLPKIGAITAYQTSHLIKIFIDGPEVS